ncbi:hypothetical protein [Kitasatospora viridis]|uniref:hypothetical protein n=1 Tax=Kitasatospora viridis TaxID=281105 RepID=UPI0011A7B6C4|nr:hypothetical protein [Kitasatospora viridis]
MKDAQDLQFWGTVAVVGAALAVVAAYLGGGAPLVWAVAGVEVLLVMVHVARRFRHLAHPAEHHQDDRPDTAHCDRCARARDLRAVAAARRGGSGRGVGHQRDAHVLHDEGPEGEGVEDLVETEPTR